MPSVITANLLGTGEVAYLAAGGHWVFELADAETANDAAALVRLEVESQRAVARQYVTAVYAMDVALVDGRPVALSVREKIRAAHRPTV